MGVARVWLVGKLVATHDHVDQARNIPKTLQNQSFLDFDFPRASHWYDLHINYTKITYNGKLCLIHLPLQIAFLVFVDWY